MANDAEPTAPPEASKRRLPAAVIALGLTSLFADIGSEMIFPLLPVFIASLGAAPAFLGLVEGLANATASLLKLASGYVADRAPAKKPLVVFGYGLAALARPLVALATAPWHVLAVRVTDRVGKGIRTSPRDVLIANSVAQQESGRAFGFHRAMDHAGAVVGPLIATLLLGLGLTMREVFWIALLPGLLSVLAVLMVREPKVERAPTDAPPSVAGERLGPSVAGERLGPSVAGDRPGGPRQQLPGSLRGYFVLLLLFSLGNSSDAFLLMRAEALGVPIAWLPVLWTVFHVSKLVSSYVGGSWSDRLPRPKLIMLGWVVYATTYLAFGMATRAWHVWALFIVYGTYYGLTEPAEKALIKDLAPLEVRGRAYGFYNFIIGVSAVPAGVLTGWLWQTFSPMVALSVGAGIAALASAGLVVWMRRNPQR